MYIQALRCALGGLSEEEEVTSIEKRAVDLAYDYLEKFMSENAHYRSSTFIREALDVLENVCM